MNLIQDKAYVLHKRKHKETSVLIDLFTAEHGRIKAIAKGVRSGHNGKCKNLTRHFVLLNVAYKNPVYRNAYKHLSFAEPVKTLHHFTGNKLACALYINELLTHSLPYQQAYQPLFLLYSSLLIDLEQSNLNSIDIKLRIFEKHMLSLLGYHYRFNTTCNDEPIDGCAYYQFVPGHGFMQSTYQSTSNTRNIFSGTTLLNIAQDDYTQITTRQQAKHIMRIALQHLTGNKEIKSRKLFLSR